MKKWACPRSERLQDAQNERAVPRRASAKKTDIDRPEVLSVITGARKRAAYPASTLAYTGSLNSAFGTIKTAREGRPRTTTMARRARGGE